jgi:ceramide glucosyltransferase
MFVLGLLSAGLYLLLLLLKAHLSLSYAKQTVQYSTDTTEPVEVTILQAILSGDPLLESSLRYNLKAVPEGAKFVWLVDDDDTVGLELTRRLADSYSNITLVTCPSVPQNLNPKVFKLAYGFSQVTTPLLAVLDDDTCLSKGSLQQAQEHLKHAEIYTGLPYYDPGKNVWSSLLAHFVNNNSILTYLPILAFTQAFSLNGMFYVIKRETLINVGGFEAIGHQLADDYAMAKHIRKHQGKIVQGITIQAVQTSVKDFRHYICLMHRWFLFAWLQVNAQKGGSKVLLFILLALPPLLFCLSFIGLLSNVIGIAVWLALLMFRYLILRYLQRKILGKVLRFSFIMSTLSGCLQPFHMLHALVLRQIIWRKRRIRVEQDGTFSYLEDVP